MGKDKLKGLDVEEQQLSSKSMGIQRQQCLRSTEPRRQRLHYPSNKDMLDMYDQNIHVD